MRFVRLKKSTKYYQFTKLIRKNKANRKEKTMKEHKISIATLLLICFSVFAAQTISAKAAAPEERYVTPSYASSAMAINDQGVMTITYQYSSDSSSTSKVEITTYIEKRTLGIFWTRVDIGTPDNQWIDTIYNYRYTSARTYQLSDTGTYRTKVTYKFYNNSVLTNTVECEDTDTY